MKHVPMLRASGSKGATRKRHFDIILAPKYAFDKQVYRQFFSGSPYITISANIEWIFKLHVFFGTFLNADAIAKQ